MDKQQAARVVVLDVDGVVSAVHPNGSVWGDEVVVGDVLGPVLLSPSLCRRLDGLARKPGLSCWWLTSWTTDMRARMALFPGSDWPVMAEQDRYWPGRRGWWKLAALQDWIRLHPDLRALAWCDDDLRGGRPAAVRRRLRTREIDDVLLIAPSTDVGLTPDHLARLEAWAAT